MKKIGLVIFVISILINVKVFANQTIITTEGTLDDSYLEEEDKQLLENNVNWNESGKYQVEYYDQDLKETITKDVLITNKTELTKGISSFDNRTLNIQLSHCKIEYISDNEYLIYGGIDNGHKPYQGYYLETFAYLSYYKDDMLVFEKIINDQRYGTVNDITLTKSGIAVIGDYDSYGQERNIFINEYSFTGKTLYQKELSGNLNDFGYKIYYDYDLLYFIGTSYSFTGDFIRDINESDRNVIIGTLDTSDNSIITTSVGNDGDDFYIDAIYYENNFYIYLQFKGDGYFGESYSESIVTIDYRLGIGNITSVENSGNNPTLLAFNDNISIVSYKPLSNIIVFRNYNNDLIYQNQITYSIKEGFILRDLKIKNSGSDLLLNCKALDQSNKEYNYISIIDDNYQEKLNAYKQNTYQTKRILDIYQDSYGKILYGNLLEDGNVDLIKYSFYELKESTIEYDNRIFYENNIYLNTRVLPYNLVKSATPYKPFGVYSDLYSYKIGDSILYLTMDSYYYPKINLINGQVYDLDVRLVFNGEGYLNNEKIDNGYIIKEEGRYVLEIIGPSEEKEVITFLVEQLSENVNFDSDNQSFIVKMKEIKNQEIEESENIHLNLSHNENLDEFSPQYFIIFSAILLGGLVGLFVPFNKIIRGRKNV